MTTCDRCGEMNPADIHTCTPQVLADPYASENDTQELLRIGKLPAALRLAELLEKTMQLPLHGKAADELRRLHALNQELVEAIKEVLNCDKTQTSFGAVMLARAAIAKATEVQR